MAAPYSVERPGYTDCIVLLQAIQADLLANGFTRTYPAAGVPVLPTDKKFVFEAGPNVDPLAATQPWRIHLEALNESYLLVSVATPVQLGSPVGDLTYMDDAKEISGHVGVSTNADPLNNANTLFLNRANLDVNQRASSPMSYRLTITGHGMALFVWEPGNDVNGNNQSWFVVQRTVNNATGIPRTTGKSPIFCVFGIKRQFAAPVATTPNVNILKRFTVREADISRPTPSVDAGVDMEDSARVINIANSVAITEDNNYVISFPNNLNTQRFAYPADELDIIAYTSADVISQNSDVSITVYNETAPRIYKAMSASGANNTGMRVLLLESGGNP